jgi:hypothetical protein
MTFPVKFYPTRMERFMHDAILDHIVYECQEYEKDDTKEVTFSREQLIFAVVALALRVKLLKQAVRAESELDGRST